MNDSSLRNRQQPQQQHHRFDAVTRIFKNTAQQTDGSSNNEEKMISVDESRPMSFNVNTEAGSIDATATATTTTAATATAGAGCDSNGDSGGGVGGGSGGGGNSNVSGRGDSVGASRPIDSCVRDMFRQTSLANILTAAFMKNLKFTPEQLVKYSIQFVGLLVLSYILLPNTLFYILLLVMLFVLIIIYIVTRASSNRLFSYESTSSLSPSGSDDNARTYEAKKHSTFNDSYTLPSSSSAFRSSAKFNPEKIKSVRDFIKHHMPPHILE